MVLFALFAKRGGKIPALLVLAIQYYGRSAIFCYYDVQVHAFPSLVEMSGDMEHTER